MSLWSVAALVAALGAITYVVEKGVGAIYAVAAELQKIRTILEKEHASRHI